MIKIGIPRGLYYFHFGTLWQYFLEELGFEVVCSPETNRQILELGLSVTVEGACLPVKAYVGHALTLAKQGITRLFVPQIVSVCRGEYICPGFLGLPDLLRQYLPPETQLLSPTLDGHKGGMSLARSYWRFGSDYASFTRVLRSWNKALHAQQTFERGECCVVETAPGRKLRLLVLGPRYLTDDPFLNGQIVREIQNLAASVITPGQIQMEIRGKKLPSLHKQLFWSEARFSLQALENLKDQIDGVVHLASFGCGSDSLVGVLLGQMTKTAQLPCLELHVDEHASPLGTKTRLEAFCDLLGRR